MNSRLLLICMLSAVGLAAFLAVLIQKQRLARLRSEQQGFIAQLETPPDATSLASTPTPKVTEPRPAATPSLELLRLRSEVARLTERRRELTVARSENERLLVQIAASRTNLSAASALPPGYVRKSAARFVGYNTPAETIQSLLWAIQNRDSTNFVAAFTPEMTRQLQQQLQSSDTEEFFKDWSIVPGMHIKSQEQMPDGSIELEVEMVPGEPLPERMRFRLINGQWKLESL